MASKHPTGFKFKVPVRPAPAPPPGGPLLKSTHQASKPVPNLMDSWDLSFDDSFPKSGSIQSSQWPNSSAIKKVPPPRPPPPKIALSAASKKTSKHHKTVKPSSKQQPSRPSDLLTNLFTRHGQKPELPGQPPLLGVANKVLAPSLPPIPSTVATASLIDLSSPPSSPTPTTRSSSDGLSVDSFGSDGTASHSHHHSQVESGFEDDSDLFGGFTATPSPVQRDLWTCTSTSSNYLFSPVTPVAPMSSTKTPWFSTPQDPFSPPRKNVSNASPTPLSQPVAAPTPGVVSFKPTIIRPKVKPNASPSFGRAKVIAQSLPFFESNDVDDRSESPPMPSIPPPAPPAELLAELENEGTFSLHETPCHGTSNLRPHCVALFDFEGTQPDDLSFKEGDVIELVRELNADWLYGMCRDKEGMFPANFVKIVEHLGDAGGPLATALYSFTPETWEDLDLQEGSKVRLLGRINSDWLYGECDGKRGQFPVTFVDHVPDNVPMRSS